MVPSIQPSVHWCIYDVYINATLPPWNGTVHTHHGVPILVIEQQYWKYFCSCCKEIWGGANPELLVYRQVRATELIFTDSNYLLNLDHHSLLIKKKKWKERLSWSCTSWTVCNLVLVWREDVSVTLNCCFANKVTSPQRDSGLFVPRAGRN